MFGSNRNRVVTKSGHKLYGISEYIAIVLEKSQYITRNSTDLSFVFKSKFNQSGKEVDDATLKTIDAMFTTVDDASDVMISRLVKARFNTSDEKYIAAGNMFNNACRVFDTYCYERDINPNVYINVIKDGVTVNTYYIDVERKDLKVVAYTMTY
jgi:hypothetical protein